MSSALETNGRIGVHPRARRSIGPVIWRALFYLAALVVVANSLFPFYWILRTSLMSDSAVAQGVGGANGLLPAHLTFAAYRDDFSQQHFLTPLFNSGIVALGTTAVTIVVASMAAYALARLSIAAPNRSSGSSSSRASFRCSRWSAHSSSNTDE